MFARIRNIANQGIVKTISVSIGMQAAGYAITLALTPLAIAFYSPADFGRFAVVFFVANLIGSYGGLKLEWAVINDHSLRSSNFLVRFSITLIAFLCIILFLAAVFLPENAWKQFDIGRGDMLWSAPMAFAIGFGLFQQAFGIRLRAFKDVYFSRSIVMVLRQLLQIGLGVFSATLTVLVFSELMSRLIGILLISARLKTGCTLLPFRNFVRQFRNIVVHRCGHYTKIALPSSILDFALTEGLAVLVLIVLDAETAGAYWLVMRIFGLPIALIGTVVGDVLQGQLAREKSAHAIYRELVNVGLLLTLMSILMLPLGGVTFWWLSNQLYEGKWALSGHFALILVPAICVQFVASPLSRSLIVLKKMQYKYIFDASLLVGILIWLGSTWAFTLDIFISMLVLSAAQVVAYVIYVGLSLIVARPAAQQGTPV